MTSAVVVCSGCRNFVNADLIARGLSPLDADAAAAQAGRIFLQQIRNQIQARADFGFETTLAGLGYVRWFKGMKASGFRIRLYYLWLPDVSLALKRIENRVRLGGHDVPADVVRRRYGRGLRNFFARYLPLADYAAIFDNRTQDPILVFERIEGRDTIARTDVFEDVRKRRQEENA